MKKSRSKEESPSELIDARIEELGDWRGETLSRLRTLIKQADPDVVEEWKWSVPVWSHDGIICTGETYKKAVKLTFAKGASLKDPSRLFNSSLEGNTRRAIDVRGEARRGGVEGPRPRRRDLNISSVAGRRDLGQSSGSLEEILVDPEGADSGLERLTGKAEPPCRSRRA
jgi:hypothetical protein